MKYHVLIRNNQTKEVRVYHPTVEWNDDSYSWWNGSNMGCDCNLACKFMRAGGVSEQDIEKVEHPCGDELYSLIKAVLENGEEILFDEDDR